MAADPIDDEEEWWRGWSGGSGSRRIDPVRTHTSAWDTGQVGRQRGDSSDWRESKTCAVCGRPFDNRKRWNDRGQWDEVRYCSQKCRGEARRLRRAD